MIQSSQKKEIEVPNIRKDPLRGGKKGREKEVNGKKGTRVQGQTDLGKREETKSFSVQKGVRWRQRRRKKGKRKFAACKNKKLLFCWTKREKKGKGKGERFVKKRSV